MINKPTLNEVELGYMECKDCTEGIHLLQAGTEAETHLCALCKCHVADRSEFFKFQIGTEVLSK